VYGVFAMPNALADLIFDMDRFDFEMPEMLQKPQVVSGMPNI